VEPNEEEDRQLRMDWEELMDLIVLGQVERITARHGEVLQLRPKAANSKALTEAIGARGEPILTLPRGFYLKKNFTAALLARHFLFNTINFLFCLPVAYNCCFLFCRTLNNVICMDNRS
jgi:DNA mismatch repair protein MutH